MTPSLGQPEQGPISIGAPNVSELLGGSGVKKTEAPVEKGYSYQDTQGMSAEQMSKENIPTHPDKPIVIPPKSDGTLSTAAQSQIESQVKTDKKWTAATIAIVQNSKMEELKEKAEANLESREIKIDNIESARDKEIESAVLGKKATESIAWEKITSATTALLDAASSVVEIAATTANAAKAEAQFDQQLKDVQANIDTEMGQIPDTNPGSTKTFGQALHDAEANQPATTGLNTAGGTALTAMGDDSLAAVKKRQEDWLKDPANKAAIDSNQKLKDLVGRRDELGSKKDTMIQRFKQEADMKTKNIMDTVKSVNRSVDQMVGAGLKLNEAQLNYLKEKESALARILNKAEQIEDRAISDRSQAFGQLLQLIGGLTDALYRSMRIISA